jgi:hypothetical protein
LGGKAREEWINSAEKKLSGRKKPKTGCCEECKRKTKHKRNIDTKDAKNADRATNEDSKQLRANEWEEQTQRKNKQDCCEPCKERRNTRTHTHTHAAAAAASATQSGGSVPFVSLSDDAWTLAKCDRTWQRALRAYFCTQINARSHAKSRKHNKERREERENRKRIVETGERRRDRESAKKGEREREKRRRRIRRDEEKEEEKKRRRRRKR